MDLTYLFACPLLEAHMGVKASDSGSTANDLTCENRMLGINHNYNSQIKKTSLCKC